MKAEKLNQVISTNVPLKLRMKKRGPSYPETNFTTKEPTGRQIYLYIFEDENGRELSHYSSETQEESLKLFQEGEWLQVVRKEEFNAKTNKRMSFYQFTPPEGAEARAAAYPTLHRPVAQARMDSNQEERERQQKAKEISIVLQAFTKSWIESGAGKTPGEACQLALRTFKQHREDVLLMLNDGTP